MVEWLRSWLLGVVVTALLTAVAEGLTPKGPLRSICRLAGGIVLAAALLRPLEGVGTEVFAPAFGDYRLELQLAEEAYQRQGAETVSAIIEEKLAAYIVDKARSLGLEAEAAVAVEPDEEGVPLPAAVYLSIPRAAALSAWITEELGVPPEAQYWQEG